MGHGPSPSQAEAADLVTIFLCGDVMTGRGIDQALPHPRDAALYEFFVQDAREYIRLAESAHGPMRRPLDFPEIWGEALDELEQVSPDVRLINLETSITRSTDSWKGKSVHYGMHPDNMPCLTAAGIDCCALANNHVLDWGYAGLLETLDSLQNAGIPCAGAGRNLEEAAGPAMLQAGREGRVLLFSCGSETSGIPATWAARPDRAGVNLVAEWTGEAVEWIKQYVHAVKQPKDVVVLSIHWGPNWGYGITATQRQFAHRLIDEADVDLVHGHSSHHVKGIEVYRGRLILYGCGDLLTDYEGICGYEQYRSDLGLLYFADLERSSGRLVRLRMTPTRMQRFRIARAVREDAQWLQVLLNREGAEWGTGAELEHDHTLALRW